MDGVIMEIMEKQLEFSNNYLTKFQTNFSSMQPDTPSAKLDELNIII